jgi:hypothetical protein
VAAPLAVSYFAPKIAAVKHHSMPEGPKSIIAAVVVGEGSAHP